MRSKVVLAISVVLVLGLAVGGYLFSKREGPLEEVAEMLKSSYGYSDAGYTFSMKSYRKAGPAEYALITVVYLPEKVTWDIACSKVGDVLSWGRAPEQVGKDLRDLEDIGHCLRSLAGGVRIGDNVYNSGSDINSCRDTIKLYNLKHPKSPMTNIGN
jgi:hypothetical protein